MANIISVILSNSVPGPKRDDAVKPQLYIYKVDAVPSAGLGTAAALGTTAIYEDGATATRYLKTGVSDVDWTAEAPATSQLFTQTNPSDWVTDPQTIQAALDELAAEAYTPSVATDWAAVPTTVAAAIDEITRNGAGHFQKARDPLLTPAPTIYVETTGSDTTGDGSIGAPFLTLARARTAIPSTPEYATGQATIQCGLGTFVIPRVLDLANVPMSGTMVNGLVYTVDALQPANTDATGYRIVLNTTDLAALYPIGTRILIGASSAIVARSDNSAFGGKLVLWVIATIATPAVNSNVTMQTFGTVISVPQTTWMNSGTFTNLEFSGAGSLIITGNISVSSCNLKCSILCSAVGPTFSRVYTTKGLNFYADCVVAGCLLTRDASLTLAPLFMQQGNLLLSGQNGFAYTMAGVGSGPAINAGSATIGAVSSTTLRMVSNVGYTLEVQAAIASLYGGTSHSLGNILQFQDLATAQIVGVAGPFLVKVKGGNGTRVTLGSGSNITIGAVLNPVAIDGVAKSTDSSGTYIVGGSPKPGANGASTQYVTTDAQTWDGISRTVVFTSATMGAAVFNLPAIALGVGVTDSAEVKLINSDGDRAVVVTPFAGEKINNVAAAFNIGAVGVTAGAMLTVRASTNNYMVS
jgi:hypothetical protein